MARNSRLLPLVLVRTVPIAALLFVAVAVVADHYIRTAVTSEIEHRLATEAEGAALRIDSKLQTLMSILHAVADNELVIAGLVDTEVQEMTVRPFFQHLTIPGVPDVQLLFTDYRGRLVASNRLAADPTDDRSWLDTVSAGREFLEIDNTGMTVAVPVIYHGRPEGSIVAVFDGVQLDKFLEFGPSPDTVTVFLNGRFVTSTNEKFKESRATDDPDGRWITSVTQSDIYPPLRIELAAPTERVFATVSSINTLLVLAMGSAMLILIVALVLMGLAVTRPLARLVGDLRMFNNANDLSRRVSSPDIAEFAEVADAFNLMMARFRRVLVSHEKLETENQHRKLAEQAVREKEAETQAVVDNVLDGIITITEDGTIRTVNAAAKDVFGYSAYEMVGQNVRMLMPEPHRTKHDSYIRNYLSTGEAQIIGIGREVTGLRKNGEIFPMELGISAMTIRSERQFTGVVRDITERKRIDRMKNEFISVVSHELRTPLTSLTGSLALVGGGALGSLPDKAQKLISIAHNNAQRLIHLVNHILDVEKIESGMIELELERLDPVSLIEKAITENASYGEKYGVTFVLRNDLGKAVVEADAHRLMQILANLLSNAAKFSGDGTKVEVALERHDGDIRFAVTDHGAGISEADMGKLFDKFSQIDSSDSRSKDGTGLGLSISQGIAHLHGSEILVDSEVGKGSTFYFDLNEQPLADPVSTSDSGNNEFPIAATG